MKCPSCNDTSLVMTDRQGVEIDYCPSCRGIWLDRGELDKLLDRAAAAIAPAPVSWINRRRVNVSMKNPYSASSIYYAFTVNSGLQIARRASL